MAKKKSSAAEAVKARARLAAPKRTSKGYDADKYTGVIPGLVERMKEYLEHMRDDRLVHLHGSKAVLDVNEKGPSYLRHTMAKKKSSSAESVKTRARRTTPKKAAPKKQAVETSNRKRKEATPQPPKRLFTATKWFGAFPELKGPTLTIQRRLRNEW